MARCYPPSALTFTFSTWYSVGDESRGMSRYFRPEGVLYESVDGLLLLLCLWQVLVIPIFMVIEFALYLPLAFHAADLMTSISVFIGLGFDALFALFSILAGVLLWLKRRVGVYLSLAFQGLRIVIVVAIVVLSCIGEVAAHHVPLGTAILHFLIPLVIGVGISSAWIAYLLTSRRIKYMYFERHEGEDWE
ncbi:MAG TPA: hypothetical protein VHS80_04690 [Chthoniobacterales bacterium]|jgi:hypothetical protein|nr:hypothetical protein [Chthoniobacterales bacterium]